MCCRCLLLTTVVQWAICLSRTSCFLCMLVHLILVNVVGVVRSFTRKGVASNSTCWRRMAIFCFQLIHLQIDRQAWTVNHSQLLCYHLHTVAGKYKGWKIFWFVYHTSSSPYQGDCQHGYVEFNCWEVWREIRPQWCKITS